MMRTVVFLGCILIAVAINPSCFTATDAASLHILRIVCYSAIIMDIVEFIRGNFPSKRG